MQQTTIERGAKVDALLILSNGNHIQINHETLQRLLDVSRVTLNLYNKYGLLRPNDTQVETFIRDVIAKDGSLRP